MTIDFETLLERSPNPYVILDPELVLVWMNDAYLRVTMRTRDKLLGCKMFDAFPSQPGTDSHELLADSFSRVLRSREPDEIALIRYDIEGDNGQMEERFWSATNTPLLKADGSVKYILQHTVDVTELHNLRRLRDEQGVVSRASAVQARNRDLAAESRRLMDMFEQAPGFVAALAGPEHRFQMTNEAYRDLVGRHDLIGKTVREALPEVIDQGFIEVLDTVNATGEAFVGMRTPIDLGGDKVDEPQTRYLNFIFQPIFDDHDNVAGIIIQGYDITEEVEFEQRQDQLIDELNHRVKNTLAIVKGLAAQSFASIPDSAPLQAVFDARLKALSVAHNLLTETYWGTAPLADIVRRSAEAAVGEPASRRFEIDGPSLSLDPQAAVSLAMIVHELCTNAANYGALSGEGGIVSVNWGLTDDGNGYRLWFRWRESGGPPVVEPTRLGFGTRLIRRGISTGSESHTDLEFRPEGLVCTIEIPFQEALS